MSKFSKRQIALTMAFASLLGGKSSALDKSLDYKAIGNQKLNANDKVSGKISTGKILAFLIPTVVVSAVVANEIFNKKYNIRSFYKKYIAKSNDEKPKDDNEKKEKQNSEITNIENNINNIDKDETIKNLNINNDIKNKTNVNNNLIIESNIKIHADNTENNIKNALGKWSNTCYEAFKKACDDKGIKSEEEILKIAGIFSKVADRLSNYKMQDNNDRQTFGALVGLFKEQKTVISIEIPKNEEFKIKISSQTFTIKIGKQNKFEIRVDKDRNGEWCANTLNLTLK
ncbi:MAG: hypothetical protein IJQ10_01095 [Clostridia bacterium]|nr:hypothetical protein [Clostridia bacterium]